jgi:CheY-like chemotaxis protein
MSIRTAVHHSILVVEDDDDLRGLLVQLLSARGFNIEAASDGLQALATLRRGLRPALILLDLMMPRMDGWQFIAEQRGDPQLAHLPVLVMSASGRLPRLPVPAENYLAKPVDLEVLLSAIGRHCPLPAG